MNLNAYLQLFVALSNPERRPFLFRRGLTFAIQLAAPRDICLPDIISTTWQQVATSSALEASEALNLRKRHSVIGEGPWNKIHPLTKTS
jgi:hypothetical protein